MIPLRLGDMQQNNVWPDLRDSNVRSATRSTLWLRPTAQSLAYLNQTDCLADAAPPMER
jgi:hypothetical protein